MRKFIAALVCVVALSSEGAAQGACDAPAPVCAAAANVVAISGFEPVGSAVVLEDGLLVTNRHMVADATAVDVRLADGSQIRAEPIASAYVGDLMLLKAPGVTAPPIEYREEIDAETTLYVIGFDVGREAVRVYAPGHLIVDKADTPFARLHHDARSLPGNSGGALVDEAGRLVGIVSSGGEGRNEAIPVSQIARLKDVSGPTQAGTSLAIGAAIRRCVEGLDAARAANTGLSDAAAQSLQADCLESENRQLLDLAGQTLAMARYLEPAIGILEVAHARDPNAPNTLFTLAITYHLALRYGDEIPVLRRALGILPTDVQLLRLALQAGIWGGDQALADEAMQKIEEHLPEMAPAARRFYDTAPPPPRLNPPK